jgi:hypothetical protein
MKMSRSGHSSFPLETSAIIRIPCQPDVCAFPDMADGSDGGRVAEMQTPKLVAPKLV